MRSLRLSALAIPILCLSAASASAGTRSEQKSLPLKPGGTLVVSTRNSAIRVEGWDKDEVAVTADINDSEARPVHWDMRAVDGGVAVEAVFSKNGPSWRMGHGPSCAFTLKVPRKVAGEFSTSNDTITAGGFGGTLAFHTSNDKVELENLDGSITVSTSNAAIRARHLRASLKGITSNDPIHLEYVQGGLDLSTSNANVTASGLDGWNQGISLRTSNGDIAIDLGSATGEIQARTSRHESVKVERKNVDLVESGGSETRVRIPGSSQIIGLTTTNGTITIR
jgi:ribosomal protein L6P/L9E